MIGPERGCPVLWNTPRPSAVKKSGVLIFTSAWHVLWILHNGFHCCRRLLPVCSHSCTLRSEPGGRMVFSPLAWPDDFSWHRLFAGLHTQQHETRLYGERGRKAYNLRVNGWLWSHVFYGSAWGFSERTDHSPCGCVGRESALHRQRGCSYCTVLCVLGPCSHCFNNKLISITDWLLLLPKLRLKSNHLNTLACVMVIN